jgi:hypothetical protein
MMLDLAKGVRDNRCSTDGKHLPAKDGVTLIA